MSRKSFVGGAIILMIAGFIVRIFGFIYRIYLSNLIGAEGMGLFQLTSPVYSLVILTLTSGISIAVSKMVAAEHAKNHEANLKRITGMALGLVVTSGVIVSFLMYLNLNFIVHVLLKDSRTYYSMLLLIPCIPVIAAASALKGYFYGVQRVVPTAVSQIAEQVVKIGLVMGMAGYFVNVGLEYACALATVGMAAGEIANLLILVIVYKFRNRKEKPGSGAGHLRKRHIIKEMLVIAVPVSFNRFITSIMSTIEQILIPQRLLAGGLGYQQSMQEFGRLSGMAMPLLFFPSLVTSSLATTLVPAISEAVSLKNFRAVNYRISKSIQITFALGFIFMAIFYSYPDEISSMIYKREKIGDLLYVLSFTCIFIYLQQTLLGTLNGLGKQAISLRNSIIGNTIRIGAVYFIIPLYGLTGYIWGTIASSIVVCVLNLYTVIKTTGMALDFGNWLIKPGLVFLFMILTSRYMYSFFTLFPVGSSWVMALTLLGNIFAGLTFMVVVGALSKEEVFRMLGVRKMRKR